MVKVLGKPGIFNLYCNRAKMGVIMEHKVFLINITYEKMFQITANIIFNYMSKSQDTGNPNKAKIFG